MTTDSVNEQPAHCPKCHNFITFGDKDYAVCANCQTVIQGQATANADLKGVGGWLAFFIGLQGFLLWQAFRAFTQESPWAIALITLSLMGLMVSGLLIWQHKPISVRVAQGYLVLRAIVGAAIFISITRLSGLSLLLGLGIVIAAPVLWLAYFAKSQRVANTYRGIAK